MFKKGDIIIGKGFGEKPNEAFHPIIYLEGDTNADFIGLMLTKSSKWKNNFPLKKKHFKKVDREGNPFKIFFKNSHCVHLKLKKKAEWNPYTKVGELTAEGIKFAESNIKNSMPIYWDDYINSIKSNSSEITGDLFFVLLFSTFAKKLKM